MCSGIALQSPTTLTPCFFASASMFSASAKAIFLDFSTNCAQASGECLEVSKNVGMQILSNLTRMGRLDLSLG